MDSTRKILDCYRNASEEEKMFLSLKYRYLRDVFERINRNHSAEQRELFFIDDPILRWSMTGIIRDAAIVILECIRSIFGKR